MSNEHEFMVGDIVHISYQHAPHEVLEVDEAKGQIRFSSGWYNIHNYKLLYRPNSQSGFKVGDKLEAISDGSSLSGDNLVKGNCYHVVALDNGGWPILEEDQFGGGGWHPSQFRHWDDRNGQIEQLTKERDDAALGAETMRLGLQQAEATRDCCADRVGVVSREVVEAQQIRYRMIDQLAEALEVKPGVAVTPEEHWDALLKLTARLTRQREMWKKEAIRFSAELSQRPYEIGTDQLTDDSLVWSNTGQDWIPLVEMAGEGPHDDIRVIAKNKRQETDSEPQPSDGPEYHADHAAWVLRKEPSSEEIARFDELATKWMPDAHRSAQWEMQKQAASIAKEQPGSVSITPTDVLELRQERSQLLRRVDELGMKVEDLDSENEELREKIQEAGQTVIPFCAHCGVLGTEMSRDEAERLLGEHNTREHLTTYQVNQESLEELTALRSELSSLHSRIEEVIQEVTNVRTAHLGIYNDSEETINRRFTANSVIAVCDIVLEALSPSQPEKTPEVTAKWVEDQRRLQDAVKNFGDAVAAAFTAQFREHGMLKEGE